MRRRTTVEIDDELLARARRALGGKTARATIEEALSRLAGELESEHATRVARQKQYLARLHDHIDTNVLSSDEMWR